MTTLNYPDLAQPPKGWTGGRMGTAIRLVPPGAYVEHSRASISISPLVAVSDQMPELDALMRQALQAEADATQLLIEGQETPVDLVASSGLCGRRLGVTVRHPNARVSQRRLYSMFRDSTWLYGIHYIADEETFPFLLDAYERAAGSIQRF